MADIGELNLGQLVRERYGTACCAVGMTTHEGEVTATHEWDEPAALRTVQPSLRGSYERLFHDTRLPAFVLPLNDPDVAAALEGPRPERAIGVIYRPETERASHYFTAQLPRQFSAVVHVEPDACARTARALGAPRSRSAGDLSNGGVTPCMPQTHRRRRRFVFQHGTS
jgi:erythromycin esterase-like protein